MPEHTPRRPGILPMTTLADLTRDTIKRECAGPTELNCDEFGNEYEHCSNSDNGHLYFHGWCLHCHCEEP